MTVHDESLNSMQLNVSDPQKGVKQEPNFEHGDSCTTNPSTSSSSSSSEYCSALTESMIEDKNKFSSELEFNIEFSKIHLPTPTTTRSTHLKLTWSTLRGSRRMFTDGMDSLGTLSRWWWVRRLRTGHKQRFMQALSLIVMNVWLRSPSTAMLSEIFNDNGLRDHEIVFKYNIEENKGILC